jgi:hypothetical protein
MHCIVIGFFLLDLPFVPNWKKKNSKIGMHPPQEHTHQSFTLLLFFPFLTFFFWALYSKVLGKTKDPNVVVLLSLKSF